jgi:hypothetical protein
MSRTQAALFAVWVVVIAVLIWWFALGGQHWLATQTGTNYCLPHSAVAQRYCYWSGFGSVFPWVLLGLGGIFTGLIVHWRHINCHTPGCWRVGRYPAAGGDFKLCGHCHPDWKGKHPSLEHILARHETHKSTTGR